MKPFYIYETIKILVNEKSKRTDMSNSKVGKRISITSLWVGIFSFKHHFYRLCSTFIKIWQTFNLGTIYQLTLSAERGSMLRVSKTLEIIYAALVQSCSENEAMCF